jgi:hypothetical protein
LLLWERENPCFWAPSYFSGWTLFQGSPGPDALHHHVHQRGPETLSSSTICGKRAKHTCHLSWWMLPTQRYVLPRLTHLQCGQGRIRNPHVLLKFWTSLNFSC